MEKIPYLKTARGAKAVKNGSAKYLFCLKLKLYLDLVPQ